MNRFQTTMTGCAALLWAAWGGAAARAEEPRGLLLDAPSGKAVAPIDDAVVRSRTVRIDFDALVESADQDGLDVREAVPLDRLGLNLFPDAAFEAVFDPAASGEAGGQFTWAGRVRGQAVSQVVIVASGGVLAGSVMTADGFYRIRPLGRDGLHAVEQLDLSLYPDEGEPVPVDTDDLPAPEPLEKAAVAADDGSTLDLLVLYSAKASRFSGGKEALEALIRLGVAETNTAFANSGVIPRVRLVHMEEVVYAEAGQGGVDLARLADPGDGELDHVHALRDQYKADFVQLVVQSSDVCGIAYLMQGSNNRAFAPFAFGLTQTGCLSNYTLPHELGHNMGCNHAPDDPVGRGAFNYSFGYKEPQGRFRTLMAYECVGTPCPRALHFSNPAVRVGGAPSGTSGHNNAQSINNVRSILANFRATGGGNTGGTCNRKKGKWAGCKSGCQVCAEKLVDYPRYLENHPGCVVNTKCKGRFAKCSVTCPAPTADDL